MLRRDKERLSDDQNTRGACLSHPKQPEENILFLKRWPSAWGDPGSCNHCKHHYSRTVSVLGLLLACLVFWLNNYTVLSGSFIYRKQATTSFLSPKCDGNTKWWRLPALGHPTGGTKVDLIPLKTASEEETVQAGGSWCEAVRVSVARLTHSQVQLGAQGPCSPRLELSWRGAGTGAHLCRTRARPEDKAEGSCQAGWSRILSWLRAPVMETEDKRQKAQQGFSGSMRHAQAAFCLVLSLLGNVL